MAGTDMNNWKNVQDILISIDNLANHLVSNEEKKLMIQWKLQIFESFIHELNESKRLTKHTHAH